MKTSDFDLAGVSAKTFQDHIAAALPVPSFGSLERRPLARSSAVVFLLSPYSADGTQNGGPHLMLTKRSMHVRQPGDLCCPGGGIAVPLDRRLAALLTLPFSPLGAWRRRKKTAGSPAGMPLLLATGLREAFEEIRLRPLGIRLLGALPPEQLVMFDRTIYPLVVWIGRQRRFVLNGEVERMVAIPLADFFNKERYGRFRLTLDRPPDSRLDDFPCFVHHQDGRKELLWGATYRITMTFLEMVFGFHPPPAGTCPMVRGEITRQYFTGGEP